MGIAVDHNNLAGTQIAAMLSKIDKKGRINVCVALALYVTFLVSVTVNAAVEASGSLTSIFYTQSFRGSWEVITHYFGWAGTLTSWMITGTCVLGSFALAWSRMNSYLYLGAKTVFDEVNEMNEEAANSRFFGFETIAKNTWKGSKGIGLNSVIKFVYSLLPDLKSYSDFNPKRRMYGLTDDESALSYTMKIAVPTTVLLFIFSVGFSGTYFKSFGMVVNAMSVYADRAVETNLAATIDKLVTPAAKYDFTLGMNGSAEGKLAQNIAEDVYAKLLRSVGDTSDAAKLQLGKSVEQWVLDNVLANGYGETAYGRLEKLVSVSSKSNNGKDAEEVSSPFAIRSESDVASIKYEVISNVSPKTGTSPSIPDVPSSDSIGLWAPMIGFINGFQDNGEASTTGDNGMYASPDSYGGKTYVHIIFKKSSSRASNIFLVEK